ncbi:MAG: pyridoxamine 5'-phosphate oxidase, partial [Planctomycetota bacterium]
MANENSRRIEEMRLNYALTELHEKDIDSDPMVQFGRWFDDASQGDLPDWMEVNAMTLSTSDGMG